MNLENGVARFFRSLISKRTTSYLLWLHRFDSLFANVYVFELRSKSVHLQSLGEVPWPLVFLSGRLHRKRVFCNRQLPSVSVVNSSLTNWANTVRWKWVF